MNDQQMSLIRSSATDEWSTPAALFSALDKEFSFTLDPCAAPENAKTERYYTAQQNGLSMAWENERVFCNPPYSKIKEWVKKCADEATRADLVVMLIPARTDTRWFHEFIYHKAEIRFIKGRVQFNDCGVNAPFPSMIAIFRNGNGYQKTLREML